jgi:iron complex outermembrane receptor protein
MKYRFTIPLFLSLLPIFGTATAAVDEDEAIDVTVIPLEQLLETDFIPASRIAKQISDAPSAVSIVTAQDIHDYGYRNLVDILRSMRGLYVTTSLAYDYLGGRGFGAPGDYAGRIMLLIDGYVTNENFYNQIFLGEDALIDVDLIERVEFIPGPGSTTYGNSAFLGVINIVTRHGRAFDGAQVAADLGEDGERRQRLTFGKQFDNGADVLLSLSSYDYDGRSVTFPQLDDWADVIGEPYTNQAISPLKTAAGERLFFKGGYDAWTLEMASSEKTGGNNGFIVGLYPADLDLADRFLDHSSFFKLNHDSELSEALKLSTSLYWGKYDYEYSFEAANGDQLAQASSGEWAGVDFKFVGTWFDRHTILFGAEYRDDYKQDYMESYSSPELSIDDLYTQDSDSTTKSFYIQDEYSVTTKLTLVPGVRIDETSAIGRSTSPRFAVIYQPLPETTLKLSYGKAFRNINPWERFVFSSLPADAKEKVSTVELVWQQQLAPKSRLTTSLYRNKITDVFVQPYDSLETVGLELGIEHITVGDTRVNASIARQTSENDQDEWLTNSPHWLAKLNIAHPLWRNKAMLGFELQAKGRRLNYAGEEIDADEVANLTLSSSSLLPDSDIRFSVRNLFDSERQDVTSSTVLDSIPLEGRNYWLQLEYNFR